MSLAELLRFPREAVIVDAEVAVRMPDQVDTGRVKVTIGLEEPEKPDIATVTAALPRGRAKVRAVKGGMNTTSEGHTMWWQQLRHRHSCTQGPVNRN